VSSPAAIARKWSLGKKYWEGKLLSDSFEVRDLRSKDRYFIDYLFHDGGYLEALGVNGLGVYAVLARHANKRQTCFPSVTRISKQLKISRRTVIRIIKNLEMLHIVKVERESGEKNIYSLIDRSNWEKIRTGDAGNTSVPRDTGGGSPGVTIPVSQVPLGLVTPGAPEVFKEKKMSLSKVADSDSACPKGQPSSAQKKTWENRGPHIDAKVHAFLAKCRKAG
jgi:hypothetical protein